MPALLAVLSKAAGVACKPGAIRALARLSQSEAMAHKIVESDGLKPLAHEPTGDDAYTTKRVLITLFFIGADKKLLQRKIAEAGVIPLVLELCNNAPHEIQMEAVHVIKVLCRCAVCGRAIVTANGLAVLGARGDERRLAALQEPRAKVLAAPGGAKGIVGGGLVDCERAGAPGWKVHVAVIRYLESFGQFRDPDQTLIGWAVLQSTQPDIAWCSYCKLLQQIVCNTARPVSLPCWLLQTSSCCKQALAALALNSLRGGRVSVGCCR